MNRLMNFRYRILHFGQFRSVCAVRSYVKYIGILLKIEYKIANGVYYHTLQ